MQVATRNKADGCTLQKCNRLLLVVANGNEAAAGGCKAAKSNEAASVVAAMCVAASSNWQQTGFPKLASWVFDVTRRD